MRAIQHDKPDIGRRVQGRPSPLPNVAKLADLKPGDAVTVFVTRCNTDGRPRFHWAPKA